MDGGTTCFKGWSGPAQTSQVVQAGPGQPWWSRPAQVNGFCWLAHLDSHQTVGVNVSVHWPVCVIRAELTAMTVSLLHFEGRVSQQRRNLSFLSILLLLVV